MTHDLGLQVVAETESNRRLVTAGPVKHEILLPTEPLRPGTILFEIATESPGFLIDEPLETLGTALKLPPHFEERRGEITAHLPKLTV